MPEPSVLDLPLGDPSRRGRHAPLTVDAITDTRRGDLITLEQLAARLDDARLVLVGEEHTSLQTHEAQERLVAALAARGRRVQVGLEMFPGSQQEALEDWSASRVSEEEFLRAAGWYEHWGYDWRLYRGIFVRAREVGAPLVALNIPRALVTTVREKGLDGVSTADRMLLPPSVDTNSEEHRRLFRAYFGSGGGHGGFSPSDWDGLFRAQCTWDAAMGWNAARRLKEDPEAVMVVVVGSGHVAYDLGIARQAAAWVTGGRIASVIPVPVKGEDGSAAVVRASYAQYVWALPPEVPPDFPTLGIAMREEKTKRQTVISAVKDGSAAARAGLRSDDVVRSIDGATVTSKEDVLIPLLNKRWGDGVRLQLERAGQPVEVVVPLRRR